MFLSSDLTSFLSLFAFMLLEENSKLVQEGKSEDEIYSLGAVIEKDNDFSTLNEKLLGRIISAKYDVDFYIIDKFPVSARPFYTMENAEDSKVSNSYDVYIRGQEVTSGAHTGGVSRTFLCVTQ